MHNYIFRRLFLMVPTLLGITLVVFAVMAASPGGITAQGLIEDMNLEPQARQALQEYYNKRYGLDLPVPMQYLRWLNNISPAGFVLNDENKIAGFSLWKGSDLGISFRYGRPVSDIIFERVPITVLLNILSIPLIYVIAITIGVRAATERGGTFDMGSGLTMLTLWSLPTMLAGVLLIGFFANEQYWRWFPTGGLNQREALDMVFMPHWSSVVDLGLLLLLSVIFMLLMLYLSLRVSRQWRVAVMVLLGLASGAYMGLQSASSSVFLCIVLALVLGLLFGVCALMSFRSFRSILMGIGGAMLGVMLAVHFMQGEFVRGFLLDRVWHLVLPVLCLSYGGLAFLSKLTRTSVLENLNADYARTARAKGVTDSRVLWHHVFRNSLLPLITVLAGLLPGLLAGSVIVEAIFSIDGMGKLAVEAVKNRDRELVLSITFISGMLTLLGYLLADICYAVADPRVNYE